MKPNLWKQSLCAGCLAAAGLAAVAAPLQRADVPADPAWVLHLDCDGLRPTAIGQYVLAEMAKPEAQARLAAFQAIFSIDLRTQVHGLTLYSTGTAPAEGVMLVNADFDPDRLLTLIRAAKDYQSTTYKQHAIHNWIDEKKKAKDGGKPRTYMAMQGNRLLIFGQQETRVAQALDVLDHAVPNLSTSPAFAQMGTAGDKSFVQAAARKIDLPDSNPHAALFRLSQSMRLQVAEAQQQVTAALNLDANNQEIATNMVSVVRGLVSLMKLQQDKPEAARLAEALSVRQDGARVVVTLAIPANDMVEIMKAGAARKAQKKAERD